MQADRLLSDLREKLLSQQWLVVCIICTAAMLTAWPADPDLFARLAVGELIVKLGYLPLQDPFAFTPKKPIWVDHEWLSGLIFYLIHITFSDTGLFVFKLSIFCATVFFLIKAAGKYKTTISFSEYLIFLVLIYDSIYVWASTVRSQVFTYLLLALFLYFFTCYCQVKKIKYLFFIPPLTALWCNLHGGFVVGLGLYAVFLTAFVRERYIIHCLLFCLSIAGTALNPYGFTEYWSYILEAVSMNRPSITEWQAAGFNSQTIIPLTTLILAAYSLLIKREKIFIYLFTAIAGYFAFSHQRHTAIFYFICMVFIPCSAGISKLTVRLKEKSLIMINSLALTVVIFTIYGFFKIILFMPALLNFKLDYGTYPVSALEWLYKNEAGGNLLVDFNNGSYALWTLYPKFQVSLDGRYEELYPNRTVEIVSRALNCIDPDQKDALVQISPDYILAGKSSDCFINYSGIYSDDKFQIFRRADYKS